MSKRKLTIDELHSDIAQLKIADVAILKTSLSMRRAALWYLWDKYVEHPPEWLRKLDAEATALKEPTS